MGKGYFSSPGEWFNDKGMFAGKPFSRNLPGGWFVFGNSDFFYAIYVNFGISEEMKMEFSAYPLWIAEIDGVII